ncbi:MAG: hypothetical protein KAH48_04855 [Chlorobi bacterium]|nr:hypothetical protein [Chlorobiota bacterium]
MPDVFSTLEIITSTNTVELSKNITVSDTLNISTGIFDVSTSNYSINVSGNWRNTGAFTERAGTVTFNGTDDQLLRNTSGETFYNLLINKTDGVLELDISSDIFVSNQLTLTAGIIDSRSNLRSVTILNGATVSRTSGHVDGEMKKYVPSGATASDIVYEIGEGLSYTPMDLGFVGTDGTTGYVSATSMPDKHANFGNASMDLASAAVVERHWDLSADAGFDLGTRTINATVTFLNPDDINGGADPDDFKMRYWDQSVWNSAIIGTKTSTTTQGTSISELSDIMVGPTGSLITYYTRQSGDWNDVATWSTVAYGGPQAGAFPDGNGSVVFIGDADTVNLDQSRSVRSVTVEEFSGGKGSLFLSDYVLSGAQFVLKNSGELGIGSADGIRSAAASGNIQTTVRNFNPSSHNSGHYIYNGTVNQNTGDALPANIATFEVDNSGNTVSLQSSISLSSDLTLTAGILRPTAAAIGIALAGDWINNSSASAYDANADKVTFFSASTSAIGGNYATTFYDVDMDKSSFNLVLGSNITVDNDFTFLSDGLLVLNSKDLTIGTSGSITGASLGSSRMVQSDGSTTSGRIIKMYSGSGMNSFTLPIGTGTDYNPAELNVDATFAAGSYAALRLVSAVHPSALTTEMLSKYWAVSSSGISNVQSATNLKYYYLGSDVNGTAADYIAARYTNDVWETNLGTSRDATSSPITVSGYTDALDGDWTAGEATSIYKGRIFYSIASGNWNNVTSWSNESHSGSASAYIPGTFEADTVFIDAADVIDYNLSSVTIGMLTIGGSETGSGELDFVRGSNKTMTILGDLKIESDGAMDQSGTGDRKDTLYLNGNLTNDNTGADAVDLRQGSANYTILAFTGLENSTIAGSGKYRLSGVHVAKEALSDTVYNLATEFSSALTTAVSGSDTDRPFKLETGVYCHDNSGYALLDVNGAPNTRFAMGLNSGLDIRQGECDFEDEFVTNTNTLVSISGGTMTVGNASNEDFLYGSGTKYTQSGGVVDVYGAFSVINATSLVDFNMSGGTLSVVMAENSNSDTDHIGFDIRSPSSTYTQSGGTVIIVTYSSSHDYQVKAGTVNVTGGTLQIGVVGVPFNSTGASIGVGNDKPTIWNLSVRSTMYNGDTYRSMIVVSSVLYVKNDIIIHPQGCLDLNTQSISFGGDFINDGIFTTDGLGWNSGGGSREVIFNGTNDVTVSTEDPIATSPDNTRFRNEAFYDVTIDKPGGSITLGDLSNSDMLVRNYLTFTDVNVANIISRTNNRMVYIDWQATGDRATVQRHGLGFVDGRLRKEIPKDDSYTFFEIGAGSVYRPATLEMIGTGGGDMDPVDFINIPGEPANIASNGINLDLTRNIQSYWTFSDPGAFNLGGRTFDLTTQFAPADVRPGGSWTSLNQYYASSVPYSTTQIGLRTDTTTQSLSNSLLGNYMLGETIGFDYYSIASGDWNNKNTWSSVGYGGAPATEYPDGENDRVYIGDGYEVVLNKIVNSRSVLIEPSAGASGQPGSLYCKVDSWLNGSGFILEDGTTLSTEHPNGITATSESGSIRTTLRDYGYSHYKYTGKGQNQSTGSGLPYDIMSLTVDNTGVDGQNTVTLTDDLGIDQDLNILNGVFDTGSKDINMIGNVLMENRTTNKTEFEPKSGTVVFDGILNQTITVNDPGDLEFNRIMLNKTGGVLRMAGNDSGADLLVRNLLRYMADNTINVDVRTNNRKLLLQNENNATIENVGSGFVDGKMQMTVFPNADTIQYKIGYMSDYMPMTMTMVGNGGSQGPVTAIVNDLVATDEAVVSKQIDPVKSVPRYWMTEGIDSFSLGGRTIITLFEFPSVFLDNFEYSSSILRRKSIPAEDPLWSGIRGDYLTWNIAVASVTISDASKYWPGLGKMYVGEMATREFYSIDGGGLWNDPASWSFTGHGGAPASGEFPNKDWETEIDIDMRDIVYIGDNDEIVLNVLPEIAVLEIRGTGSLVIPDDSQYGSARFIIPSSFGTSSFEMFEDGLLVNKSESNLQSGTAGIIRFLDADRTYSPLADFEFSGAYNQYVGDAFPTEIGDLTINTDINSRIVSLLSGSLIINENLNVLSGDLRPQDATTNVRLGGSMTVNGSYNGTINPSGTSILSTFTFQGDGAADQVVSGTGNLLFADVTMNRGTGAGAVDLQTEMTITHVMDLREGTNANNQIFSVGDNQQLWITGTDVDAIIDYGDNTSKRMIRTAVSTGSTSTVGLLMRSVTQPQAQDYVFPVGSYSTESGEDTYSPAQFSAENSGGSGYIGLRVSRGSGINYNHARLSTVSPNYLQRYWTIDEVTTTIPGQWRFLYNDSDIFGNETDIGVIGRYNPAYEAAGGSWTTISGVITRASNYFETPTGYLATDFTGDYTISNLINFGVFFYSRQSGPWNDPNTWTYSPTHSGAAADTYPQIASDNVIIGGGFYDIDQADHIVSFVENINSVGDVLVGTALNNTGTLNCANYSLQGSLFEISDHSTLQIGASDGIFEVADQGNIRTTTRIYDSEAIYEYKGIATSDQAMGDGMPASVFGFIANHQDATHNFSLVLDRDVQVTKFLELKGGRVDAGNHYEMLNFATVPADGQFIIQDGAVLAIGGTRIFDGSSANSVTKDFVKTIVGYAIAPNSTVEYYNIHTITPAPNDGVGYGNVELTGTADCIITQSVLCRGNFSILGSSTINNINNLKVLKEVINESSIENNGLIEIGE